MIRPPPSSTLFPYTTLFRSSSVTPSANESCSGSPLRLLKGRMAMDGFWGTFSGVWVWSLIVLTSFLPMRSEEHTSELQSHHDLVCRLLLEKKNKINTKYAAK